MNNEAPSSTPKPEHVRQKALQEELAQLVDVVGPGPLVDLLLERAFQLESTDIHFDPTEDGLRIRLRVDGLLHDVLKLPAEMTSHVVSRIKLMANMNITERRFAQDGHISNSVLTAQRDVRVGSGPTIYGERIVLRLMPDQSSYTQLEDLGFEDQQLELLKDHARRPSGMVMSVGPVGSGKSTSMYSCLHLLNDPQKSIATIEDPVERRISGINQIQTDPKIDFGFVEALRGVLRQDPNIMMIGEIRDPETAHIGCRAALTGVMVLSTMHANDSASTIDVFREFGIAPMFIADSVNCLVSQRLVRRVCPIARETYHPDAAVCEMLGVDPDQADSIELVRGVPDDANFHTGYSGRTGVFEILVISRSIREAILQEKTTMEIREMAKAEGMLTLEDAMRAKVLRGETSIEELHRVISTYGL